MQLRHALRAAALRVPAIRGLAADRDRLIGERGRLTGERDRLVGERDRLRRERDDLLWDHRFVPPGHFYSPIPSLEEIGRDAAKLFGVPPRTLPGIDLREDEQLELLASFQRFYDEMPFAPEQRPGLRYGFENDAYSYADAIMLHCMLRHLQPRRIVEIGSGHSSCVTLDTNERCFGNRIETVFIEPYPDLLHSLLRPGDSARIQMIPSRLQDVPAALFEKLGENDVLFIDSTHVGKVGSDVNIIFAEILPALRSGVFVHFHDIFYPFEYPRNWIDGGRAWNEAYMLRCFLQYNAAFRVELWNHFLAEFNRPWFEQHMKLCLRNTGASLWLRRL